MSTESYVPLLIEPILTINGLPATRHITEPATVRRKCGTPHFPHKGVPANSIGRSGVGPAPQVPRRPTAGPGRGAGVTGTAAGRVRGTVRPGRLPRGTQRRQAQAVARGRGAGGSPARLGRGYAERGKRSPRGERPPRVASALTFGQERLVRAALAAGAKPAAIAKELGVARNHVARIAKTMKAGRPAG